MGAGQRRDLMEALFEHVVGVLADTGLHVVTLSPHAIEAAPGTENWVDGGSGLNAALDLAVIRAGTPVLIVHADLPSVERGDVEALIDSPGDVVIARANDGGTNALLMRTRIRCAFGPGSALAHAARARASGLRALVVDRPGLALDVDDEASLSAASSRTSSWRRSYASPKPAP
jgi:2-phospho-L-lactate guanylyltransferase